MPHLPIQLQVGRQRNQLTVHSGPHKSLFQIVLEKVTILTLLATDHRRQNQDPLAFGQPEDVLEQLLAQSTLGQPALAERDEPT